jgi:hypothetical protein
MYTQKRVKNSHLLYLNFVFTLNHVKLISFLFNFGIFDFPTNFILFFKYIFNKTEYFNVAIKAFLLYFDLDDHWELVLMIE